MGLQGRPPAKPGHGDADRPRHRSAAADPERTQKLVWSLLSSVARADMAVSADEQAILERYRRALEVRGEALALADEAAVDLRTVPVIERVHALRMMFGVAYSDGSCSDVELNLLRRLAGVMGLSAVHFADTQVFFEQRALDRRRRRWWLAAAAGVVLIGVAVGGWLYVRQSVSAPAAAIQSFVADATRQIGDLERRVGRVAESSSAGGEAQGIAEVSATLDGLLARAEQLEAEHARAAASDPGSGDLALIAELESIKRELAALREQLDFPQVLNRYSDSVLFIQTSYALVSGERRFRFVGDGTGFFVTADGVIVTNKHVVQPWKFDGRSVAMLDSGYRLDEQSVRLAAWPNGARVTDEAGVTVLDRAFDSGRGELEIAAMPPDALEQRSEPLGDGRVYEGRFHAQDESDLALLQATVPQPVVPIPVAEDTSALRKLDPVMVLGFPTGKLILESGIAETLPTRGEVLKIDRSLFITAQVHPGSSGGPVIDRHGHVVGIATRRVSGDSALGVCIRSAHVLRLLRNTAALAAEATPTAR